MTDNLQENISGEETSSNADKIDSLNVDASWKKRFKLIDEYITFSGNNPCYKANSKLEALPREQKKEINFGIIFKNGGTGTFFAAYFFGLFYYLFKGMWLKAIVYTFILSVIFSIIVLTLHIDSVGYAGGLFFALMAPYDYYRLKVLGKQW